MRSVEFQRTKCPRCGSTDTLVRKTRRYPAFVVRYHICRACLAKGRSRRESGFRSRERLAR
jgi:late competence protein required for DNA uptake (superfamily II DNA/RNA helicase)